MAEEYILFAFEATISFSEYCNNKHVDDEADEESNCSFNKIIQVCFSHPPLVVGINLARLDQCTKRGII